MRDHWARRLPHAMAIVGRWHQLLGGTNIAIGARVHLRYAITVAAVSPGVIEREAEMLIYRAPKPMRAYLLMIVAQSPK